MNPLNLDSRYSYDANQNNTGTFQIDNYFGLDYINTGIIVEFNELRLPKKIIDSKWQETRFEYDTNANLSDIHYPDNKQIHYVYDSLDRLKEITYTGDTTKWSIGSYDPNGNIKSITKTKNDGSEAIAETMTYDYDELDRLKKKTIGTTKNSVEYQYDQAGKILEIRDVIGETNSFPLTYYYDSSGLHNQIEGPNSSLAAYMHDEQGRIQKIFLDNQAGNMYYITYQTYDDIGNIKRIWTEDKSGNILMDNSYEYDSNGNRVQEKNNLDDSYVKYEYDAINQLLSETYYDNTQSNQVIKKISYLYEEDTNGTMNYRGLMGNRTKRIIEENGIKRETNYSYNAANEITDVDGVVYEYDQRGNLTFDGKRTYVYNVENQLIEVIEETTTIQYEYNPEGLRSKKIMDGKTEMYYYNGTELAYITDGQNNLKYYFTRDAYGRLLNMIDYTGSTPVTYWYLFNAPGEKYLSITFSMGGATQCRIISIPLLRQR